MRAVRTLYIRNVPDAVASRLEELAARAGVSLNALAVRELTAVARRSDNAARLATLPDTGASGADIVDDLTAGRATRA
jgi:plasmid stability protein